MSDSKSKEEEKEFKFTIDYENFKYELPPKLSDEELKEYRKEVVNVYKHKCEYKLNESKDDDKKQTSISFYPSPHVKKEEYGKEVFDTTPLLQTWMITKNLQNIDGMTDWNQKVICNGYNKICSFILCCCKAWEKHYPLKISPSHILLLVLQGIAIHVDGSSEKLRNKFVKHENKMKLEICRDKDADNFIFARQDKQNNDWSSVIEEFCEKISKNTINDTVALMESDFSCSSIVDRVCAKATIMDICKNYFEYYGYSGVCCGFPKITLDGTKNDWIKLRVKCERLLNEKVTKEFGAKWSKCLLPILDRFIAVYDGNIDCVFWNSMIRYSAAQYAMSGPPTPAQYCGWLNVFFPFMQGYEGAFEENSACFREYEMNKYHSLKHFGSGLKCSAYPQGLSAAPVKWHDLIEGKKYDLKFYSGFTGYIQDKETFELEPVVSWFIGHNKKE